MHLKIDHHVNDDVNDTPTLMQYTPDASAIHTYTKAQIHSLTSYAPKNRS